MNIEQTNCPELEAYIPNIFKFIQMSTDKGVRPTVKFLSTCVSLLSDFANIYASVVKPQLSNFNFIPDLIKTLQKHNTNQEYTRLLKYAKEHLK